MKAYRINSVDRTLNGRIVIDYENEGVDVFIKRKFDLDISKNKRSLTITEIPIESVKLVELTVSDLMHIIEIATKPKRVKFPTISADDTVPIDLI